MARPCVHGQIPTEVQPNTCEPHSRCVPGGQISGGPVQPFAQKYSSSLLTQIKTITAPSCSTEGRLAIVTNAGQDAMDADGASDEQHVKRTAKSCGSDAPTLASSWQVVACWRRWQQSPVTGKSTKETVKTIARGMPGDPGVTVVTMLVCFFILHARLRAHRAPGIPCALCFRGTRFRAQLGRFYATRSRRCVCATIIAVIARSEATKQSIVDPAIASQGLLRLRSQ
jgi:hypothetical protein